MKTLFTQFQTYLNSMTGLQIEGRSLTAAGLPHYLGQAYALYALEIEGRSVLGIALREPEGFQPAQFEKQLPRLLDVSGPVDGYCVIASALSGYVRQRLIARRIPIVIPGRQINWPMLGAVVEPRSSDKPLPVPGDPLKPATQLVILHALNSGETQPVTARALTQTLGYTPMTMSRALDDIEANNLGRVTRAGRERQLDFPDGLAALWQRAQPLMRDPVRDTVRVWKEALPEQALYCAGESALARRTLLAAPNEPVWAIGRHAWKPLAKTLEPIPIPGPGAVQLQLWRYEPGVLASDGVVDPFSLYLNLRETRDERIQMELDAMMEEIHGQRTGSLS